MNTASVSCANYLFSNLMLLFSRPSPQRKRLPLLPRVGQNPRCGRNERTNKLFLSFSDYLLTEISVLISPPLIEQHPRWLNARMNWYVGCADRMPRTCFSSAFRSRNIAPL